MQNILQPIVNRPSFKPFLILDVEAQDWTEYVVGGMYDGEKFEAFGYDEGGMEELLDYIFDEVEAKIVFCHFGGKYDLLFVFNAIISSKKRFDFEKLIRQGSRILTISITRRGSDKKLTFWDSSALLPFKLESLCKAFDVSSKKGKVDYNFVKHSYDNSDYTKELFGATFIDDNGNSVEKFKVLCKGKPIKNIPKRYVKNDITYYCMEEDVEKGEERTLHHIYNKAELISYLINDCKGLYQVLEKFYSWDLVKKSGQAFTMASQAQKVYRTFLSKPIYGLNKNVDEFVRQSYQGGRVEIFKPVFLQKNKKELIECYDVNSLFPFVMKKFRYPLYYDCSTMVFHPDRLGFYDVTVKVPDMHIPPLGIISGGKFIFPVGTFRGVWTIHELNCAIKYGTKILKIHKGMLFKDGGYIFQEFVDTLYQIRIDSPKDSVHNMIAKLILNASYGKWGINNDKEDVGWEEGEVGEKPFAEVNIGNKIYRLCSRPVELMGFSNVAVASYVTSYSRVHMYENYWQPLGKDLYYCDTDSLYTTKKLKSSDTELGMIKREIDKESGEYGSPYACFFLPKTYITKHLIKMKGIPKKCMKFNFQDFYEALQGEKGRLKSFIKGRGIHTFSEVFRKNVKITKNGESYIDEDGEKIESTIVSKIPAVTMLMKKEDSEKVVSAVYDKRIVIKNGKPENWTTKPLTIDITKE